MKHLADTKMRCATAAEGYATAANVLNSKMINRVLH